MSFGKISFIVAILAILIGVKTALAIDVPIVDPYFPIKLTTNCALGTAVSAYCITPASGPHYKATPDIHIGDFNAWMYSNVDTWSATQRITAMCIAWYESGLNVYHVGDNYPSYQSESSVYRFDYGLMQINSVHTLPDEAYDPYYLVTNGTYNMSSGNDIWAAAGGSFNPWTTFRSGDCAGIYQQWETVTVPTCSYNPAYGYWDYWSNATVLVQHLGYPGDNGNTIANVFCYGPQWAQFPGVAKTIGAGGAQAVWSIRFNNCSNFDCGIWRKAGYSWNSVLGVACDGTPPCDQPGVGADGQPWVNQSSGDIYHLVSGAWQYVPGKAWQVSAGLGGQVWAISQAPVGSNYGIYFWNGSTWAPNGGAAVELAVASDGSVWAVLSSQSNNAIYQWNGSSWTNIPGAAYEVVAGGNGAVFAIGTNAMGNGNYGIWKALGGTWHSLPGAARHLAVDSAGKLWALQANGTVWYCSGC